MFSVEFFIVLSETTISHLIFTQDCMPYNYQLWLKAIRGEMKLRQAFFIRHSPDAHFFYAELN